MFSAVFIIFMRYLKNLKTLFYYKDEYRFIWTS